MEFPLEWGGDQQVGSVRTQGQVGVFFRDAL
ncbi:hypothetical protein TNCT_725891, partial [Trichonephila clavata]